ncbi:hypothetical protein N7539_007103 [Penicillium diatomitis]|uniref:DNA endonuclease activator Ctp1 C-terminal domain-containing protein n=1 Tax=Penicillium diatomitis TaxID=2819901 RepID=A0A9X0BNI7_9EURO|nr:uncharacterized protein N7539_007103 [Penicillium diatomitis]KAJ5476959.1 hypothetical protein N7539_007103 [Penicillium diatomitis]
MEVFEDLQAALAQACTVSVSHAQKQIETTIAAYKTRLEEAERCKSAAVEAQRAAEERVNELQRHVGVLKRELGTYNIDPRELEPPKNVRNLEKDYAPSSVWKERELDSSQLHEILKTKYTMLYDGLREFVQSWSGLKAVTLQHKKKLQNWERQLKRKSFSVTVDNSLVTFTRSKNHEGDTNDRPTQLSMQIGSADDSSYPAQSRPQIQRVDRGEHLHNPKPATACGPRPREHLQNDKDKNPASSSMVTSTEETLTSDGLSSESSSDLPPNLQTRKRKRIHASDEEEPRPGAPEKPVLIKSEILSSSPARQDVVTHCTLTHFPSTQDLDEIGGTVQTPTKKQPFKDIPQHGEKEVSAGNPPVSTPTHSAKTVGILQPVDGNARASRIHMRGSNAKKPRPSTVAALMMAEDGDSGDVQDCAGRKRAKTPINGATPKARQDGSSRLHSLLEGLPPSKSPLQSPIRAPGHIPSPSSRLKKSKAKTNTSASPRPQAAHQGPAAQCGLELRPEDEPFRSRPLHRLGLHHFKINPAVNAGLDFAYSDVIRRKDERKCMSGCTRSGCCGDRFRAMARMAVHSDNKTAEQIETEQRIIRDYLGENGVNAREMTEEQCDDLLVEAFTRHYANQYGRHRHTHERARSPPGFWRTEMPSTQEIEADREAARKMEREKVEDRYREAMRPGGRWLWADE